MNVYQSLCSLQVQNEVGKQKNVFQKQLKKVSSGEKFSNAGGAAAEYKISEKMKAQIRGLDQTSRNLEIGKAVTDTASKALDNVYDILATIKEKTIESANGIHTDNDRRAIQGEVSQLVDEITDIAYTTQMNGIYPLLAENVGKGAASGYESELAEIQMNGRGGYGIYAKGDPTSYIGSMGYFGARFRVYDNSGNKIELNLNVGTTPHLSSVVDTVNKVATYSYNDPATGIVFDIKQSFKLVEEEKGNRGGSYYDLSYEIVNKGTGNLKFDAALPMDPLQGDMLEAPNVNGTGQLTGNSRFDGADLAGGKNGTMICNPSTFPDLDCDVTAILTGEHIKNQPDAIFYGNSSSSTNWNILDGTIPPPSSAYVNYHSTSAWLGKSIASGSSFTVNTLYGVSYPLAGNDSMTNASKLWIQSGTESNSGFYIPLCNATADNLGIADLDISTADGARKALIQDPPPSIIDAALEKINKFNGCFGAYQQRMESNVDVRNLQVENLTNAESVIRDADIAKEMVGVVKSNILVQSSQAMLSHANQSMGSVLKLLQ